MFRGVELGVPIDQVEKTEKGTPRYKDHLGLYYEQNLGENREFTIEYYAPADSANSSPLLSGILADLKLRNEREATKLYEEIELHFERLYGGGQGTYGANQWRKEDGTFEVFLKLREGKQRMTINFVRPKGY